MLDIQIYGSDVLREKALPVDAVDAGIRTLAQEMLETMYADNGIGLAAEQVGRRESVCVVDVPVELDLDCDNCRLNPGVIMPLVLINPKITRRSDDESSCDEGCLSFPGMSLPVKRANAIDVRYLDLKGETNEISVRGLVARAIQHEMDHLAGVLIVDRTPKMKRLAAAGQLKKLKRLNSAKAVVVGAVSADMVVLI